MKSLEIKRIDVSKGWIPSNIAVFVDGYEHKFVESIHIEISVKNFKSLVVTALDIDDEGKILKDVNGGFKRINLFDR